MRLARLRHQMLIAMGIPACWTGPSTPTTAPPPASAKVSTVFDGQACPRDSIIETACGSRREGARSCGQKGSTLQLVEEAKLWVTPESDGEPSIVYKHFAFDREATRKYREDLSDPQAKAESCCYSQCAPIVVGTAEPVQLQPGYALEDKCMPAPPNGTSKPSKEDPACAIGVAFEGVLRPYASTQEGECCYSIPTRSHGIPHVVPGRALRVDGVPHVAEVARGGAGWTADLRPDLAISDDVRARLARVWLETAQLEHASIAAFASLALRLVGAGAPAELIAAAHAAALDEIKHARIAFELASAYAGERLAPGRFEIATRAPVDGSIAELALETFVDGCINETAAAHQAELAAEQATDPVVAAALREIADDEARHAALAWAVVAWCVRQNQITVDELRTHVRQSTRVVPANPLSRPGGSENPLSRPGGSENNADLASYGVLGDGAAAMIRENVLRDVVAPCIDALTA